MNATENFPDTPPPSRLQRSKKIYKPTTPHSNDLWNSTSPTFATPQREPNPTGLAEKSKCYAPEKKSHSSTYSGSSNSTPSWFQETLDPMLFYRSDQTYTNDFFDCTMDHLMFNEYKDKLVSDLERLLDYHHHSINIISSIIQEVKGNPPSAPQGGN